MNLLCVPNCLGLDVAEQILAGARDFANMGIIPGGAYANLPDAQTSIGLLVSLRNPAPVGWQNVSSE